MGQVTGGIEMSHKDTPGLLTEATSRGAAARGSRDSASLHILLGCVVAHYAHAELSSKF